MRIIYLESNDSMGPLRSLAGVALAIALSAAQTTAPPTTGSEGNNTIAGNGTAAADDGKYEISAEGIRALFIPYGVIPHNVSQARCFLLTRLLGVNIQPLHQRHEQR